MKPVPTKGETNPFVKPEGWDDERDGRCGVLSVRVETHGVRNYHISTWKPDADELAKLASGACVELTCVGLQPPVAVAVGDVPALPGEGSHGSQ